MVLPQNHYMHKDALGSIDTITNESGVVIKRMSYKPFGEQIEQEWINETSRVETTKRGFTGHEHIKEFGLIHMNGRVYDPTTGRFLSADPHIQAPYDTQSYNRYTCVKNNPLKYTDPSGFFFKKLFKAIKNVFKAVKKYIKVIVAVVVTVVIAIYMPYLLGWSTELTFAAAANIGFLGAVAVGAVVGFASGAIMTGTLSGAFKGALWGGISAGVVWGIGHAKFLEPLKDSLNGAGQHIMHGLSRAAITKAQGGRWSSGFWSGLAGSALGTVMGKLDNMHLAVKTVINSVASGLISKVTGGKFASGAVSGAFQHMFNDEMQLYMKKSLYGANWYDRQKNAETMFDTTSKVSGIVAATIKQRGLNKVPIGYQVYRGALAISVTSQAMKYAVTPDGINIKNVINENLKGKGKIFYLEELQ